MRALRLFSLLLHFSALVLCQKTAKLVNNGYEGVVIAIDHNIKEDSSLIDAIKIMMEDSSSVMFRATKNRAYFRDITILVPKTWTNGLYSYATNQTFENADIRVAPTHPYRGDNPYAWGDYRTCGKQGQYIHLTPDYITKESVSTGYGPRGKVVVHEWGHYRWGIQDEHPTGRDSSEKHANSFYVDRWGKVQATRCSVGINGRSRMIDSSECQYNQSTRLPLSGCKFQIYSTQNSGLQTSLMNVAYIDEVFMFCHDDPSDQINMHNREAPNNQNRRCDHRSTWDVIMSSVDFQRGSVNPPNPLNQDTRPRFTIVKHQSRRIVLVMDVSSSMDGEKILSQNSASELFLTSSIADGSFVGLVEFGTAATILSYLTEVRHGDGSREDLAKALPTTVYGRTAIGTGILTAIEVLENSGQNAAGGQLIVLTDGEENIAPLVNNVAVNVLEKGIVVHAVFFGLVQVDDGQPLAVLSQQSGGNWYFASGDAKSRSELNNIFATLARPSDGDFSSGAIQVVSTVAEVQAGETVRSTVAIDSSIGNRTLFIFTWTNLDNLEPEIELTPPESSCMYSNVVKENQNYCSTIHVTDLGTRAITFTIPGTAQVGEWVYLTTSLISDSVTVTVTSAPSTEGVYPITVEPELELTDLSGNQAALVIAKVFQNEVPVLGANVFATIDRPEGEDVILELIDNGAGADEIIDDGVYSRYFANFSAQGRYSVQVTVRKDGSEAVGIASVPGSQGNFGEVSDDGTFVQNPNFVEPPSEISGAKITGSLERVASSPGIAYTGPISNNDIHPPNKITDLTVRQVDLDNASAGVLIKFTAPGDDYDSGTASRYDVRYTNGSYSNLISDFDNQLRVNTANEYDLKRPKPALNREEITVFLSRHLFEEKSIWVEFAIRAFDEVGNPSEVSNIASMAFFFEPPPLPPTRAKRANIWIIVGATLSGVALILIIIVVVIMKRKRKRGWRARSFSPTARKNFSLNPTMRQKVPLSPPNNPVPRTLVVEATRLNPQKAFSTPLEPTDAYQF